VVANQKGGRGEDREKKTGLGMNNSCVVSRINPADGTGAAEADESTRGTTTAWTISVTRIAGNTNGRSYPYGPPSRPDCGHKYLADERIAR